MSKIAVVYWSGTGNTEAMAASVLEGIREAGAEAVLFKADEFNSTMIDAFDAIAFGCPSKKRSLHQCLHPVNITSAKKRSLFLALTDGETESGCAVGKKPVCLTAPSSPVKA